MILLTSGCSYTYGEELINLKNAWPYKLAEKLNIGEVINKGLCSGSNDYITRSVIDQLSVINSKDDLFVVLGFTTENRREAYCNYLKSPVFIKTGRSLAKLNDNESKIIRYSDLKTNPIIDTLNNISQEYLNNFENDPIYCLLKKMDQILLMHNLLKSLNIKHLFFNSISNIDIKPNYIKNNKSERLIHFGLRNIFFNKNINKENYINFITMDSYCQKYPTGPINKHPLEEGHFEWANFLYDYIKEHKIL